MKISLILPEAEGRMVHQELIDRLRAERDSLVGKAAFETAMLCRDAADALEKTSPVVEPERVVMTVGGLRQGHGPVGVWARGESRFLVVGEGVGRAILTASETGLSKCCSAEVLQLTYLGPISQMTVEVGGG